MKLLNRLFKKTPPPIATIDEQIKALALHSNEQLVVVATTSSGNDTVREAAIAKLSYGSELLSLITGAHTARIQAVARKRIGQLLDDKVIAIDQLAKEISNPIELMAVVSYSSSASLAVLAQITDSESLLKLAREASTTQIRQAAAAKITERDQLEQLAKTAQSKDKNVYKLVRARLDVFRGEDAKFAELEALALIICIKLEKHSHLEADTLFKARLAVLQQEWAALGEGASAVTIQRYLAAVKSCEAKISAQADAIAQEEENVALDQQALALAKAAVENSKTFIADIYSAAHIDELLAVNYEHKLQELAQAIRLAANRNLPMDSLNKEFELRKQQTLQLVEQIKNSGTLAQLTEQLQNAESAVENTDTAQAVKHKLNQLLKHAQEFTQEQLPETVANAQVAIKNWAKKHNAVEQAAKNSLRELNELIRKGLWSVEQGFVRKARAIQKELSEKRQQFPDLPKAIQARLDEFEEQIIKLGDWHEFAVTPKKEALVTQMQALINSTMAPEDLATKIHELQDSWKEVSKGGQQKDEALWQQFHQASEVAFAPCKEFFDAQAAAREKNLTKRQEMVTHLQHYLASYTWDKADWAGVEKTLKVARQEWQLYWPVPRKAGNELQHTFEALMEQLFAKITNEYETNKSTKQQLIETAQGLLASDDVRAAIDSVKKIQAQWKTIGKSWYKEDQQLWQDFRQHCDAIFARRNQEIEASNHQRQEIQKQADALLAKLAAFLALPLAELVAAKAEIEAVKADFFALSLPRDTAKALNEKLNATIAAIAEKIDRERNKAEGQSWLDMFSACDAIRDFELAIIAAKPEAEINQQKNAVEELIANTPRWPSGSQSVLQQRFAKAPGITVVDQEKNTQSLRVLTVRAEILAGRETPTTDKLLRMNYQVQQMQQAFGSRDSSFNAMVLEWIAIAGVAKDTYSELLARFNSSRENGVKK
jgi:DNA repair protein SbcC/Rad50